MDDLSYSMGMPHDAKLHNWDEIEAAARQLGVTDEALRKWAERGGVPGKWQVPIIVQSNGRVSVSDFPQRESV